MKNLTAILREQGACGKARAWAKDLSPEEAYATCERGDWLLWIHTKLRSDEDALRKRVLVAGLTVNLVRSYMTDKRSTDAVDAAIAFGKGEIGIDELQTAVADAICAAVHAANAAKNAAYAIPDTATYIAACAAHAVANAAADAYAAHSAANIVAKVADVATYAKSADIFRAHITLDEMLNQLNQLQQ